MENSSPRRFRYIFPLVIMVVIAAGFFFRQDISDWYRLRDYSAPSSVAGLAKRTTMTDEGKKLFYVSHPNIYGKVEFNRYCNFNELSIILGCYVSNRGVYGDIYLYNIKDSRLNGVLEVTAAHEMLHAAYERLGPSERERVDKMLANEYKKNKDKRLSETIEQYKKQDPNVVPNELHSILGTESRDLSPDLEAYYSRYFRDREKVVSFSEQYESEFTKRRIAVDQYDLQLKALKEEIESNETIMNKKVAELRQEQTELEKLRSSAEPNEFNSRVSSFNQSVGEYNALVSATKGLIARHNELVSKRNEIALEAQELAKAIDSRPQSL